LKDYRESSRKKLELIVRREEICAYGDENGKCGVNEINVKNYEFDVTSLMLEVEKKKKSFKEAQRKMQ